MGARGAEALPGPPAEPGGAARQPRQQQQQQQQKQSQRQQTQQPGQQAAAAAGADAAAAWRPGVARADSVPAAAAKPGAADAAAAQLQAAGETAKRALGGLMLLLACVGALAALRLLHLLWPARYAIAAALAAGEVAFFFLWYRRRYTQLNTQPAVHAPAHVDSMRLFNRFVSLCHSLPDGVDIETYLSSWFRCGAPRRHLDS
jgi:hypothetical protein